VSKFQIPAFIFLLASAKADLVALNETASTTTVANFLGENHDTLIGII